MWSREKDSKQQNSCQSVGTNLASPQVHVTRSSLQLWGGHLDYLIVTDGRTPVAQRGYVTSPSSQSKCVSTWVWLQSSNLHTKVLPGKPGGSPSHQHPDSSPSPVCSWLLTSKPPCSKRPKEVTSWAAAAQLQAEARHSLQSPHPGAQVSGNSLNRKVLIPGPSHLSDPARF